jgi:magnesium transporter
MPELQWKFGYPAVLMIMFALLVMMLLIFRKRKWL